MFILFIVLSKVYPWYMINTLFYEFLDPQGLETVILICLNDKNIVQIGNMCINNITNS